MPPKINATVTFADIQNMLVAGGYFRARLTAVLTEFDIIAGGLSWGVRNSRFTIDVEFVEDAAIRHKIKIAENICRALKEQMKCPHDLLPHQISGLDYPSIAVVLRWLLAKIAATREENAYFTRQHAKLLFERKFGCALFSNLSVPQAPAPGDELSANTHLEPLPHRQLSRLHQQGPAPARVMVPSSRTQPFSSSAEHIASVLLEYGDRYVVTERVSGAADVSNNKDDRHLDADEAAERRERQAQLEQEEREKAMLERLAVSMAAHHGKEKLTTAGLGNVLASADSNKLQRLRAQYEERKRQLEEQLAAEDAERGRLEQRRARLTELQEETAAQKAKWKKAHSQAKKAGALAAEAEAATAEEEAAVAALEAEVAAAEVTARLDSNLSAALDAILSKRNEILAVESELQAETERQIQELSAIKSEVGVLQQQADSTGDSAASSTAEFDRLSAVKAELERQLHEVALSNLDLQRRIDSYPNRMELEQYNIRVTELDEEIAWKYEETKMSYYRFNTQVEVRRCADNELEVFSAVRKQYDNCAATTATNKDGKQARADFLEDVDRFVKQLSALSVAQRSKLGEEEKQLRDKADECALLVHRQQEITNRLDAVRRAVEKQAKLKNQLRELEETAAAAQDEAAVE